MKTLSFISVLLLAVSCASIGKRILDSSGRKPKWMDSDKITWKEDKNIFFKGDYMIRGNERANACIDLAKIEVKSNLISEIQEELKGAIDTAQDSIREDAEIVLSKSRSSKFSGQISGLHFTGKYWEKYISGDNKEKISCYVLGKISKKQYLKTKRNIVNKITAANKDLKDAVRKKQVDFFKEKEE